jgi:hypothetical protein
VCGWAGAGVRGREGERERGREGENVSTWSANKIWSDEKK